MKTSKTKANWYYVIVGLILLAGYLNYSKETVDEIDLTTRNITIYRIEYIKAGWRGSSYHRLWSKETKAAFTIDVPGSIAAKWTPLDSLRQGDSLFIKYSGERDDDLENIDKEIPIYFLQKGGKIYFDTPSYNQSKSQYDNRWNLLALIGGVLLLLSGLTLINSKTTYILAGLSFVTIVVLRILGKF